MGLLPQMARVLLNEHKYRPITGKVLLIGRQTVPLSPDNAMKLISDEGVAIRPGVTVALDHTTRNARDHNFIADRSLFNLFSDATVQALDVSDYEGAEIVCNLNDPIPDQYVGQFDFIYNGSVLDNLFDPATSIKNLSRLLKPGGRIVHLEHGTPVNGPYLIYPVDWFFDYYAINEFQDCKTYVAHFDSLEGPWDFYAWDPVIETGNGWATNWINHTPFRFVDYMTVIVAEKGNQSTWDRSPIQSQYRSEKEQSQYLDAAQRFWKSERPKLEVPGGKTAEPFLRMRDTLAPRFFHQALPKSSLDTIAMFKTILRKAKNLTKKSIKRILRGKEVQQQQEASNWASIPRTGPLVFCRTLR